jgi:hypothetical protein
MLSYMKEGLKSLEPPGGFGVMLDPTRKNRVYSGA